MTTTKLYVLFFGSFFAALFLVPLAIKLAHRFGVLDQPGHRKIHTEPMARLGGVAILAAALVGVFMLGSRMERARRGPVSAEQAVAGADDALTR